MDDTVPTKKRRSRTSKSPDDDDYKRRGRPRVEKQDESAADRRRTQIRMAQRAYRQRKESTLEELRKRVSELSNTIELMNKAFLDCRDRLSAFGLADSQLQDMRETSMQYENLMRCVRNPAEDPPPASTLPETNHRASTTSSISRDDLPVMPEPQNVPAWMDEAILNSASKQQPRSDIGMGYRMMMQDPDDLVPPGVDYFNFEQQNQALMPAPHHRGPNQDSFDAFRVEVPESMTIPPQLTPPTTYSFHETTFGRRLHRACLEQGYHLLLDPTRKPASYERVFRLSLMGRDRAKLTQAMKAMLDRGPHEPLDLWGAPLIHVGGAGTHYPRIDQYGNLQPKKESYNLGLMGPQTLALLENAARDNVTTDMTVDIAGFEGEWFDPYDVEGYLAEKGISIDPGSSFAEAEITDWSAPSSTASSTTATSTDPPKTPPTTSAATLPYGSVQTHPGLTTDQAVVATTTPAEWDEFSLANFTGVGFSDASTGSWMNFLQPGEATKPSVAANPGGSDVPMWDATGQQNASTPSLFDVTGHPAIQPNKRTVIIDVTKFVKVLTVAAVCIGRTPGFKRQDVDRALTLASFDALS